MEEKKITENKGNVAFFNKCCNNEFRVESFVIVNEAFRLQRTPIKQEQEQILANHIYLFRVSGETENALISQGK